MQASDVLPLVIRNTVILFQRQRRGSLEIRFAPAAPGPYPYADESKEYDGCENRAYVVNVHRHLPAIPAVGAELLQIRDERVHLRAAVDGRSGPRNLFVGIRIAKELQGFQLGCDQLRVDRVLE